MKALIITLLCFLFAITLSSQRIIEINESGRSSWGAVTMLAPVLIINSLDTIPVIDSVVYEKIRGEFYRRDYYPDYTIIYVAPEDSISLDADSIAFELRLDSLYREYNQKDRQIDKLLKRVGVERENRRELKNEIKELLIKQEELLKTRRKYYRKLD